MQWMNLKGKTHRCPNVWGSVRQISSRNFHHDWTMTKRLYTSAELTMARKWVIKWVIEDTQSFTPWSEWTSFLLVLWWHVELLPWPFNVSFQYVCGIYTTWLILHYVFLHSLISGNVTSLYFSNVHPAALATHALNDIPRVNRVLAVDSTLLHDTSLVESMST